MTGKEYDVLIIGGGVVGSAVARELSRYRLRIGVVDKALDVCTENSGRNTGMLHAGFTYQPGSLKAQCAVEGNAEFDRVAGELEVPFRRTGKLVVGFTGEDEKNILKFKAVGEENGVPGLEMIDRRRMDELDPSAGGSFAMHAPTSGILNPFAYTVALAENAAQNGVQYHFGCEATGIGRVAGGFVVHTPAGDFSSRWVINSAGASCVKISGMLGITHHKVVGFKGEYIVLDKRAGEYAKIPVYPAPNASGGFATHATPTIDGNVLVGPNSYITGDMADYDVTQASLDELVADGRKMFAHMKPEYYIRSFAGIRAKRVDPETGKVLDFLIETREELPGFVNLIGIESPGVTSALPLARRVAEKLKEQESLAENPGFAPRRKGILCFAEQDKATRQRLTEENPDYGEIICRCEQVTRAELLQAIRNPLGVHTLSGIKSRVRCMMGRCQGGYCEMRITAMLEEELGLAQNEILLGKPGSYLFTGRVR